MEAGALVDFARIKPLAAWSLSAAAVGGALALDLSGDAPVDAGPMAAAMVCVVLMQYVSHPLNDLTDHELDRAAAIESTGRRKPLVSGKAGRGEVKGLSAVVVLVIVVLMAYLVVLRPLLLLPAAYGMFALLGYSHAGLRLSYRPFTELYLGVPVNTIAVLVIAYVGSGRLSVAAVAVAVVFGFAASAFFVSMMSMDYPTDRAHGKETTVVRHPRSSWCTLFPAAGLALALVSLPVVAGAAGSELALAYGVLSAVAFSALIVLGRRADRLRHQHLDGAEGELGPRTGDLRLKQLYVSVAYAVGLTVLFLVPEA